MHIWIIHNRRGTQQWGRTFLIAPNFTSRVSSRENLIPCRFRAVYKRRNWSYVEPSLWHIINFASLGKISWIIERPRTTFEKRDISFGWYISNVTLYVLTCVSFKCALAFCWAALRLVLLELVNDLIVYLGWIGFELILECWSVSVGVSHFYILCLSTLTSLARNWDISLI